MALAFVWGLFGLIIGSFLNVVIIRRGAGSVHGRSACMSCGTQLRAIDMVPVVSWLVLRGKCHSCGSRISAQYPLVEASTGILFALLATAPFTDFPTALLRSAIAAALIALFVYDLRHTIIPDPWVFTFMALALLSTTIIAMHIPHEYILLALLSGPAAAFPLFLLWLVSGGRWMGFGDVKLALGIGWLLGPAHGIVSVFFAFVVGAMISVCILLPLPSVLIFLRKRGIARLSTASTGFTMKSEVPFGPFLVASCFILWLMLIYQVPLPLI